jgi:ribose transport system substrate-binding protein
VLLLELVRAGTLVHGRMSGVLAGLKETVPDSRDACRIATLDGDGQFKVSFERVRKHLRESQAKYVLVGAANDPSALGAARAFQEAAAARAQSSGRTPSPMRARVARGAHAARRLDRLLPRAYGEGLIRLALDILSRKAVPPRSSCAIKFVTRENVDHLYPNDELLGVKVLV